MDFNDNDFNDNKTQTLKAFKVYSVAGHLVWLVVTPLLLFIWGGSWLLNRFNLPDWLMIIFVLTGLLVMVSGVWVYLRNLINTYEDMKTKESVKQTQLKQQDYDYDK